MSSTSILRSAALLGVAVATLAAAPAAMAIDQGLAPRPDFPGAKQQEQPLAVQPNSPRPDFPGAKQPGNQMGKTNPQSGQNQGEAPSQK
jgi:hypothetical protein